MCLSSNHVKPVDTQRRLMRRGERDSTEDDGRQQHSKRVQTGSRDRQDAVAYQAKKGRHAADQLRS